MIDLNKAMLTLAQMGINEQNICEVLSQIRAAEESFSQAEGREMDSIMESFQTSEEPEGLFESQKVIKRVSRIQEKKHPSRKNLRASMKGHRFYKKAESKQAKDSRIDLSFLAEREQLLNKARDNFERNTVLAKYWEDAVVSTCKDLRRLEQSICARTAQITEVKKKITSALEQNSPLFKSVVDEYNQQEGALSLVCAKKNGDECALKRCIVYAQSARRARKYWKKHLKLLCNNYDLY